MVQCPKCDYELEFGIIIETPKPKSVKCPFCNSFVSIQIEDSEKKNIDIRINRKNGVPIAILRRKKYKAICRCERCSEKLWYHTSGKITRRNK